MRQIFRWRFSRGQNSARLAAAFWLMIGPLAVQNLAALTVTAVTSGNGRPAHQVQWTDGAGFPRTAVLVDQSAAGPGYLYQLSYQLNGSTRVCTGPQGTTGYPGDGFVQNHVANGDDRNSLDQSVPGATAVVLAGGSHAIISYSMPTYAIPDYITGNLHAVPTTIHWFFADGRSHPVFAISQDARATPGNLGADTRSPYGSFNFDGGGQSEVGGASYGDTLKFVTLAPAGSPVTGFTGWSDTTPNTIPYAMEWAVPSQADAEWGHVATLPITVQDEGTDRGNNADTDARHSQALNGPLLADGSWAFQVLDYLGLDGAGNSLPVEWSKLAWGGNFGRVGGFDNYNYGGSGLDGTQYSQHYNCQANQFTGVRAGGLLMAYSVFVVLGAHSGSYTNGSVGTEVAQMENSALATFSAVIGTVKASGPAGVGGATNATIAYSPAGYNPTYSAWEIAAQTNTVKATLTPAANRPLDHPILVVDGYTNSQLPASIAVGAGLTNAGVNYFASLDTSGQRLWITVNRSVTNALNLVVGASGGGGVTPAPTITSFAPPSGSAGTSVVITGAHFTGVTAVSFNGVAASFVVNSDLQITATVPASATTGPLGVTSPAGAGQSSANFTVPVATANLPIYGDSLLNGFLDYSWAMSDNVANPSPVYSGTASISVTAAAYTALSLFHRNFSTAPYASLSFWICSGPGGAPGLQVMGVTNDTDQGYAAIYDLPTLTTNWVQFNLPLSALGVADTTNCSGFWIWPTSGTATFYVDSIELNGGSAPGLSVLPSQPRAGALVLQLSGVAGQTYWMETSSNLVNWTVVSTNLLTSGTAYITNAISGASRGQFWRAYWP